MRKWGAGGEQEEEKKRRKEKRSGEERLRAQSTRTVCMGATPSEACERWFDSSHVTMDLPILLASIFLVCEMEMIV